MPAESAAHRAAEQAIFRGAQDAGVRIAGITTSGVHDQVLARSKDAPIEIGARTSVTVRVAEDGTLLPRRENSDASTPEATSILEIEVVPSVEHDSTGQPQLVWNAYVSQSDVATGYDLATSRSTPAEVAATGAAEQMVGTPEEAVAKALEPLVSGGKMNEGRIDPPPVVAAPPAESEPQSEVTSEETVVADPAPEPKPDPPVAAPKTNFKDYVKRGAAIVAVAGVVAGGTFIFIRDDSPESEPATSQVVADAAADESADESANDSAADDEDEVIVDAPTEDETVVEPSIECAEGLQADLDGDPFGSGATGAADEAVTKGTNVHCSSVVKGSFVFTMTVEGDGEAVTQLSNLRWYNPRFILNSDPDTNLFFDEGGFTVDVSWSGSGGLSAAVLDADFTPVPDAEVAVEWVHPSTLVVTVTGYGDALPVLNSRIELVARLESEDGSSVDYEDNAVYDAQS